MNYKEKLEMYLNKKDNEFGLSNSSSMSKNDDIRNSTLPIKTNFSMEKEKHRRELNELGESLDFETRNYQRVVEECLNFKDADTKTVKHFYNFIILEL